jgi:heavy metal sensor kinase
LVLARETGATEAMLGRLAGWFIGLAGVTLGLAAFAAWWAVRRGLEPLAEVREAIEAIDDRALASRLDEQALPAELRPTVARVNALLARLEQAFERERRFTADVAHELRTPLSVLRAELELSLKRERSPAEYRESQRAALAGVEQLATLVDDLLTLVRLEHGPPPLEPSRFALAELVDECWGPHAELAATRGLELRSEIDGAIELESDRDKLRVIISNLLANAAAYTELGGWIRLESAPERGLILAVVDSGPPIPEGHRERLFERFWRADEARADDGEHCGVGLALARALAEHLGYTVRVVGDDRQAGFLIESADAPASPQRLGA